MSSFAGIDGSFPRGMHAVSWPISFFVDGLPQTKGSWAISMRRGRPRLIPDNEGEPVWAQAVAWTAKLELAKYRHVADDRRYAIDLTFALPPVTGRGRRNRRDLDKLVRSVLDALTSLVWIDDEQVDAVTATKRVRDPIGVMVSLCPIT